MKSVEKLLIANRGEIACRIIRTCRNMGIPTVAVYSEADKEALHVRSADEAYEIGPAPVKESYLRIAAILDVMKKSGANAVHPGYGLLSENAGFARAVQAAGHIWIGPAPDTIDAMGDKERARELAIRLGVPVAPGSARFKPGETIDKAAVTRDIGYPLLVKAAAGGGGIGMRIVNDENALENQVETTQKLAERTFGDPSVFMERYVANARHVELQVFGFGNGEGIHLFDRDCSIQRRFQKIIEEAPAPALSDEIRQNMREAALKLIRHQSYLGAGTVEFIYDCDRNEFYFLEMNTRIQVEHAVTEMVTGVDLVKCQIEAAIGSFNSAPSKLMFDGSIDDQLNWRATPSYRPDQPHKSYQPWTQVYTPLHEFPRSPAGWYDNTLHNMYWRWTLFGLQGSDYAQRISAPGS